MRRFLLCLFLACSGLAATPAPGKADERNFLVLPIATDLQRSAFGSRPGARAYVLVNGKALVQDGDTVQWKALDFDAMRKDLTPLQKGKDPVVIFRVFHDGSNQADASRLLGWALVGFGREAGYRDAWVDAVTDGKFDWKERLAAINEKLVGTREADEPYDGDDAVKVSPVRTMLSRHLFGNADCVVTITQPFGERWDGKLRPDMEKAIRLHIANLKLTKKGTLLLRICFKKGAQDASDLFHLTAAKELAEALGFEHHTTERTQAP